MKKSTKALLIFISFFFLLFFQSIPANSDSYLTEMPLASTTTTFDAISESPETTNWIMQGAEITALEDFHDDIATDYWNLVDVSSTIITSNRYASGDAYIKQESPDQNYGSSQYLFVDDGTPDTHYSLIKFPTNNFEYFYTNSASIIKLWVYILDSTNTPGIDLYQSGDFTEGTVTWNTKPSIGTYFSTSYFDNGAYFWGSLDVSSSYNTYHHFRLVPSDSNDHIAINSRESANDPYLQYKVYKNYFGSGYMYMQTDTTELISLKSQNYDSTYNLSAGDYFAIDFQTNSDSKIELKLYNDDVLNKTLTLSPAGNSNFNRHTAQIVVDEDVAFDQLKISSTFEDGDYLKLWDIKTFKYTPTGDYYNFWIGSYRTKTFDIVDDTYNLRIFENGEQKINTNITIPTVNHYIYEPISTIECRVSLFNTEGTYLNFYEYHVSVNRSLNGVWDEINLIENIFYADISTNLYFTAVDRFETNITLKSSIKVVSSFIDLELEVYQLQIKNMMQYQTTVDINGTYTYPLLPYDSLYFMLSEEYYQIGYYDDDNDYQQFLITLDSNQAYVLNRSQMCFLSYTNQRGQYLEFYQFKTYINGTLLYQNIFYEDIGDDVNITITDHYDYQVHSEIYSIVAGDNYVPVILTMYSLKVMNQQEMFNHINIARDPNYYESEYSWSEWIAPNEIVKFQLFAGYYKINLTDTEHDTYSYYSYTLNGDDILLITSNNTLAQIIYNIANVNTTIGNQITNVQIDLTNQNSAINNSIININIDLSNVNSSLGDLLTNIDLDITNLDSDISNLYTFVDNSFINLDNAINSSFIYMENNILNINQSISTLVIGIDNNISIMNASIHTQFIEMNNQFIVTQTIMNLSFAFLNQSITQIANNISDNHVILYNLIEQRANDINNSLVNIQTLINLLNSSVANESLTVQTLINVMGNNMTNYYSTINNLLNLIDNNITNNNIQLVSILELIGNNITTNHFVIENLLDVIGNNITSNHIEVLTNLNLINMTIDQNQIELINRLLLINTTINDLFFDLSNQILLVNDTIYTAVLNLSTNVEFGVDVILGNLTLTYQQNEFLTELYKETMFSQLINWTGAGYNYSIMENRIDVWEFINNYNDQAVEVQLRYQDEIETLTISAQNTIEQYLPNEGVEYRLYSLNQSQYLTYWEALPETKTVSFGFYETEIPLIPEPIQLDVVPIVFACVFFGFLAFVGIAIYLKMKYR